MTFRAVLDIAVVLVLEVYRELGVKFEEAHADLSDRLADEVVRKPKVPTPSQEAMGMQELMAVMRQSDFRGAKN